MGAADDIGLYGKLPGYGDFVTRNLAMSFIEPWASWLDSYVAAARRQIGDDWLEVYLTSPIWRFVLSIGAVDEHPWCGLMMPSVDKVGRYFPISVLRRLSPSDSAAAHLFTQQDWYRRTEQNCLQALDQQISVEELLEGAVAAAVEPDWPYRATSDFGAAGPFVVGLVEEDELALADCLPSLLDAALGAGLFNYSLWQTEGSERIAPLVFACQGLPPGDGLGSMLDGQWRERCWKIPFNLQV